MAKMGGGLGIITAIASEWWGESINFWHHHGQQQYLGLNKGKEQRLALL